MVEKHIIFFCVLRVLDPCINFINRDQTSIITKKYNEYGVVHKYIIIIFNCIIYILYYVTKYNDYSYLNSKVCRSIEFKHLPRANILSLGNVYRHVSRLP